MGFFMNDKGDVKVGNIVISSVATLAGITLLCTGWTNVNVGCTGVKLMMGSVQEDTLSAGFHLKVPFIEKIVDVNNKVQKIEVDAGSTSKDLQSVDSTLAVNYHLAKESSVDMYKNIGLNYEDTILQPAIQEATKSVMARYRAEELIQIQVRSVFDEAWGEIDHNLLYPSNLQNKDFIEFSKMLNRITGFSNEMSSYFRNVIYNKCNSDSNQSIATLKTVPDELNQSYVKHSEMANAYNSEDTASSASDVIDNILKGEII